MLISETKNEEIFPKCHFLTKGFSEPYRIDRVNTSAGGILCYRRYTIKTFICRASTCEMLICRAKIAKAKMLIILFIKPK